MIFNRNEKLPDVLPNLHLNNRKLSEEKETKFLGITLNNSIGAVRSGLNRKMRKHCGILNLVSSSLTSNSLTFIYYALVLLLLPYCVERTFTEYAAAFFKDKRNWYELYRILGGMAKRTLHSFITKFERYTRYICTTKPCLYTNRLVVITAS